ncbi:hypothetical protein OG738_13570 [Amycolatopsis sp. NBC_01488]|uniref:hypothetical protein n=1 Tax=Amycolatopsis sp. NBC_01488 TaxID=2903563 RepID=UPI002E2CF5EE|nr:hypothetical protein [Amycolatopsis sp. NBC_01488]
MAADENDDLSRAVRKLAVDHAETRWLALRVDDDVKEIRADLRAVQRTQQEHTDVLQEHTGRFDSIDAQLRSLTQMVGQVLEHLEPPTSDQHNNSGEQE